MSAAIDAWIAEARALPIEAGLLGRPVQWKNGGRGTERCGPCPACGGDDRFSINIAKGVWNCRGACGGRDAISLAMHVAGAGFLEAVELLVGERPKRDGLQKRQHQAAGEPENREADGGRGLAVAARIVAGLRPVLGSPGERYLAEIRRIDTLVTRDVLERTDAIGWHPAVYFHEPGHELHGQHLGCIVGIMTDAATAKPTGAISRTYLTADLRKIGKAKTLGRPKGIIRLSRDEDVHEGIHLAEGIETALTVMANVGYRPTWATGDTGAMASLPLLPAIESLTIFADHDRNSAGEHAARELATRWREAGREVHIRRWSTLGDLNDAIRKRVA
jgi:hypothetical protein